MNRIFKRKLVFVKVCSPFSFIRFTNAKKNLKKKKEDVRRSLSWFRVLQVQVSKVNFLQVHVLLVQSSPVLQIQYAQIDRTDSRSRRPKVIRNNSTFLEANKTTHKKKPTKTKWWADLRDTRYSRDEPA